MLNFSSELEFEDLDTDFTKDKPKKTIEDVSGGKISKLNEVYPDPYDTKATPFDLFLKEHTVQLPVSSTN